MGLPNVTDNYKGYDEGDLSKYAEELRDKQFLLVSMYFKLDLVPLQSKFFPAKFFICFWNKEFWRKKITL
jgi:hypothetical protein